MVPLERAMVVSYRLSIVTVEQSVINRGVGDFFGPNLGMFPLEQTRHVGVAKSEHPKLTNGEVISEELQPM